MLTLTINSPVPLPPEMRTRTFERCGATVGRGPVNDWILPDPGRHLSKRHFVIAFDDGRYSVTDTSTNGVFVNDAEEPLGRGNSVPLQDGDRLTLGDYVVDVRITSDVETVPHRRSPADDTFAAILAADDASPVGEAPPVEDVDPFGLDRDPTPSVAAGPAATPGPLPGGSEPFPLLPAEPPPFATGTDWSGSAEPDHVAAEHEFFRPPEPQGELLPEDWDSDEDLAPPAAAAPETPPPVPAPRPAAAVAPQPGQPSEGAVVAAFLAGVGLEGVRVPDTETELFMRAVGETFREMAAGLREVLTARSSIKNELRLDRTMIGATDNNPLKFSATVDEALLAMLRPPVPGYLPAVEAVREGFNDLRAHEVATMAGMQVALSALLAEFDPENLKGRLDKHSSLVSILHGSRKAKYWQAYEDTYGKVSKEAEDSFHGLFGRAFARAYEEQVKKL